MSLIYRPYESTNIVQRVPGMLLCRNYVDGGISFLLAKRLHGSKATVFYVWIKTILDQFFLLVVDSVFSVVYFNDCFLLVVLKGWQNGLQCVS